MNTTGCCVPTVRNLLDLMRCIIKPAPLPGQSLLRSLNLHLHLPVHGNNVNIPNKISHAFPTHGSAGLLQHL